jgi:hypothetical protein
VNYILDIWNQITGAGIVEPSMLAYAMFVILFIVLPVLTVYLSFKLLFWFLTTIRDWWHDGSK